MAAKKTARKMRALDPKVRRDRLLGLRRLERLERGLRIVVKVAAKSLRKDRKRLAAKRARGGKAVVPRASGGDAEGETKMEVRIKHDKKRACGCKARGRHKKACHKANGGRPSKAMHERVVRMMTMSEPRRGVRAWPQDSVDPVAHAKAKLGNADKAVPDGAPKRRLSERAKAAVAKLTGKVR